MSRVHDSPPAWHVGPPRLPDETPEIRALAEAYGLFARWPRRPNYLDHLLEVGRVVVARSSEGMLGYGGALLGDKQAHLTDLFVRADKISRGIGGAILAALDLDPTRTTTFASADPRAQRLYGRLGLHRLEKLSYLGGRAEEVARLRQLVKQAMPLPGADVELAIKKHLELRGGLHGAADISFLVKSAQALTWASGYAWLRVANDDVCLGPIGSDDEATAASVLADALLSAIRLRPSVQIAVAHSHPAYALMVRAGFTTHDLDTVMTGDRSLIDLTRYCPDPDLG